MKLIAGLGNPGREYQATRHNVGFRVLDLLAARWSISVDRSRFDGLVGDGMVKGQPALLLKPMTFMNRSGQSVVPAWRFYKLAVADLLIIADDMDLPLGKVRIRSKGSSGGQKGLGDIIRQAGQDDIHRLRIGIGRTPGLDAVNHVLGRFGPDEQPIVERVIDRAADMVESWIVYGIDKTMNLYNDSRHDDGE